MLLRDAPWLSKDVDVISRVAAKDVDLELRHLVHPGSARTPLPGAPTVDRISSVVLRGVSHKGRLIGTGARNQEQEGNRDTKVRQVRAVRMT